VQTRSDGTVIIDTARGKGYRGAPWQDEQNRESAPKICLILEKDEEEEGLCLKGSGDLIGKPEPQPIEKTLTDAENLSTEFPEPIVGRAGPN